MVDIIRRIDLQVKSTGTKQATDELEDLAQAYGDVGTASQQTAEVVETATRRELSSAQALKSLRLTLDEVFRTQQKYANGVKVLDANLKSLGIDEHARLMGLLKVKYSEAAAAANQLEAATKAAAAAQRSFTAMNMSGATAGKGSITQRTMAPSSSLEAASITATAAERQFQSMTIAGSAAAAGAISTRTMAVNQLGAATNTAATAERSFQSMTIAGSAQVVGSITQRTMAVNQLKEATEEAIVTQRRFTAMTLPGAPAPRGRITGSVTGFQPRQQVEIEETAQVIPKITRDMDQLGGSTKLTAFEVTNLGMQFNDIAVMAASGQNPMVLIMQQGMQLAQIMAMSSVATQGLKGTLAALGGAVVTFLTNPFYLAVAAAAALAGAIMLIWENFDSGAPDAEESLKRHEALLERIAEAYGKATIEAIRLHEAQAGLLGFQAQTNVLEAQDQVAAARDAMVTGIEESFGNFDLDTIETQLRELQTMRERGAGDPAEIDAEINRAEIFKELADMTKQFNEEITNGDAILSDWIKRFVAFGESAPADIRAAVVVVLDFVEALDEANKRLLEAQKAAAAAAEIPWTRIFDPGTMNEGWQDLSTAIEGVFRQVENRRGEEFERSTDSIKEYIEQLRFEQEIMVQSEVNQRVATNLRKLGADATAEQREEVEAITRAMYEFENATNSWVEAMRRGLISLAPLITQFQIAWEQAQKAYKDSVDDAKKAADAAARDAKQAADAAAREAERKQEFIDQLRFEHEIMDMLEEDQAVANNLRKLGADATAQQKTEVEALTRSMEEYKAAVKAAEEADKAAMQAWEDARDKAIEKMDEFRDTAKGILSAFIEGGPTAALEAFASRLAQLGEDLVISGLFGEQGQAGGGLFGDMIQSLLGPIGDKPVATAMMNVTASVVNVGGPGAFVTGAAPAGGVVPGGMGAMPGGMGTGGPGQPFQAGTIAGVPVSTWTAEAEAAAVRAGIDPATFVQLLRNEGLQPDVWQSYVGMNTGHRETSYGPGQLLVGGGLGDAFQRQTGLNLADPTQFQNPIARQQYFDFITAEARRTGWSNWMGARDNGMSNWQGINRGAPMPAAAEIAPLTTAATTAAPAVKELSTEIAGLESPISQAVPGLQQLASSIMNFAPGGISISSQAAAAITANPFGGFYAEGGTLGAGRWGIAGEKGPEIIHGPASITPMQRGTNPKFNVNIKTQEGVSARVTRAEQNEEGDFDLEVFAEAIERRVRDKYGLRQQVSRWGRA